MTKTRSERLREYTYLTQMTLPTEFQVACNGLDEIEEISVRNFPAERQAKIAAILSVTNKPLFRLFRNSEIDTIPFIPESG